MKRKINGLTVQPDTAEFESATLEREEVEVDEADILYDNFRQVIDNINWAESLDPRDANYLDEETAEELRQQALADYQYRLMGEMGYELDDEEEEAEYSSSDLLATFSTSNGFGQALLELVAEEYEDPEEGLGLILEHTGLSEEQLVDLIEGNAYPDEDLASAIAECFETTSVDEDAYNGLMYLAEEASADVDDDLEDSEEEDAAYSAYQAELIRLRQEKDQLEAEFKQAQTVSAINENLADIQRRANDGVRDGWLPPVAQKILISNFNSDTDRIAAFSQMCEGNSVDPETQLFAMNYVLEIFSRCGQYGMFSQIAEVPLTEAEFQKHQEEDEAVEAAYKMFRQSMPLPKA